MLYLVLSLLFSPRHSLGILDTQGQFSMILSSRKDSSVLPLSVKFSILSPWVTGMLSADRSLFLRWGPGSALQSDRMEEVLWHFICVVTPCLELPSL